MKYLRSFNEKKLDDVEIYNLSKDYLAYLFDEDFACDVHAAYEWGMKDGDVKSKLVCNITLTKYGNKYTGIITNFEWDECKDQFTAFIHLLSKDYNVEYIRFGQINGLKFVKQDKRTLQQLLDNEDCDFKTLNSVTAVLSDKI